MACAGEPDPGEYYEGSCPILIECADVIGTDEQKQLFRAAYGVDGSCWAHGPNYWDQCRTSCVTALASINLEAQSTGDSCGDCEADSDCAAFGTDARCVDGWCARPKLGDIDDPMADSGAESETGGDSGSGTVQDEIDPTCLVDAPKVVMETSFGTMTFQLDRVAAKTVSDSFLRHLSSDFYDETIVHRVVDGLLMQSGVYAQGPVLRSGARAHSIGGLPMLSHVDGAIALVVTDQNVAAQWYVTEGAHPELDGTGAVFGKLIDGAGVRDQISAVEVSTLMWMGYELLDYPLVEIVINDVYCVEP
jgi:peptidyl-prolyl cis-trans isomerase A (cyclophilin A)